MAKKKKDLDLASSSHLNQIQGSTNAIFNVIFVILPWPALSRWYSSS